MSTKTTVLITILGVFLLASNIYLVKRHFDMSTVLNTAVEQVAKVDLELGKAQVLIAAQKLVQERALQELSSDTKKFIKDQSASVMMLLDVKAQLNTLEKKVKVRTRTVTSGNAVVAADIPEGQLFVKKKNGKYEEVKNLTWSYQDHRITANGDAVKKEFSYKLHQTFIGKIVEVKTKHGPEVLVELYETDKEEKILSKLTLKKLEVLKVKEKEQGLSWWNPKVDIGVSAVATSNLDGRPLIDVGLSLASYGSPLNPKWRFIRLGFGGVIDEGLSVSVSPAAINLGRYVPLISNFWITPLAGYVLETKRYFFGGGVSVVF